MIGDRSYIPEPKTCARCACAYGPWTMMWQSINTAKGYEEWCLVCVMEDDEIRNKVIEQVRSNQR